MAVFSFMLVVLPVKLLLLLLLLLLPLPPKLLAPASEGRIFPVTAGWFVGDMLRVEDPANRREDIRKEEVMEARRLLALLLLLEEELVAMLRLLVLLFPMEVKEFRTSLGAKRTEAPTMIMLYCMCLL